MGLSGKIIKAFDLAVLLPLLKTPSEIEHGRQMPASAQKTLGVSICHYERYIPGGDMSIESAREQNMLKALTQLVKSEKIKIRLIVFNGNPRRGDVEITTDFYNRLSSIPGSSVEMVTYQNNPLKTWEAVRSCDALLGVRLHSAIFAYAAKVPFLLVEYHPKCSDFMTEIGCTDTCRLPAEMRNPSDTANLINEMLHGKTCCSLPLEDAQQLALQNFYQAPWFSTSHKG